MDAAGRFGLHALEDPDQPAGFAAPLWRRDLDPFALAALARPSRQSEAFDLRHLPCLHRLQVSTDGCEFLFIGDGQHAIRLDIVAGSLCQGPVDLLWALPSLARAMLPISSLERLAILCRTGRLPASGHPSPARARQWIAALRVRDALASGATHREIASVLFGGAVAGPRWRIEAASYRSRVRRLVCSARRMANQGVSVLLRPPAQRSASSKATGVHPSPG